MDVSNPQDIERIVRAVLQSMNKHPVSPTAGNSPAMSPAKRAPGVFERLDDAVAAADTAHKALRSVAMRRRVVEAIRHAGVEHARELAELAVAETGMGRVEDKIAKNVAQARGTPGVECLSPQVLSGDRGLTLIENAAWGVIASVTPSTNPAATPANKIINALKGRNAVIVAPSPKGWSTAARLIEISWRCPWDRPLPSPSSTVW